jgi:hypothetical protein
MQGTELVLSNSPIEERRQKMKTLATVPAWLFVLAAAVVSPYKANAAEYGSAPCTVSEVAVFENRIHVRCTNPQSGTFGPISFFAVSTGNSTNAARFLTIFNSALVENRKLTIQYELFDISGQDFGCMATNCRAARGAFLGPRQ